MKRKSALQFRQEFGNILDSIESDAEPVLIERNARPVAVVVSYETFQRKFVDQQSHADRLKLLERFRASAKASTMDSLQALRALRYHDE
jgi:prevent-host-death family protein